MNKNTQQSISKTFFIIFVPFACGFVLTSIFRTINAVQAPALVASLGLSANTLGLLTAAYFLSYGLAQLPVGILLDHYGPKRVQMSLLFIAIIGILLFAIGNNATTLTIARLIIGIGVSGGLIATFKANTIWFSRERLALLNSMVMASGGIGAILATSPTQIILHHFGWRNLNFGLAIITILLLITVWLVVPKDQETSHDKNDALKKRIKELGVIYSDKFFWKVSLLIISVSGFFIALQGLWAGSWLRNAENLSQPHAAFYLFLMAIAMTIGVLSSGVIADVAQRFNISLKQVMAAGCLITLLLEILIVSNILPQHYIIWIAYGFISQTLTLAFAIISHHFPEKYTGRAVTGINYLLFLAAFVIQYLIGLIITLWPHVNGIYPTIAYQIAFGVFIVLQIGAFLWFLIKEHR